MSSTQLNIRKEVLIGGADTARTINPQIRNTIRAAAPDMSSTEYHWVNLSGASLTIFLFGDVVTNYTITFTGSNLSNVLNDINTTDPVNLWAEFQDGFLIIKNLNPGGKNSIAIAGGTAASILGFASYPNPLSIGLAGDISFAPGSSLQSSLSKLISKFDTLSDTSINRSLTAILSTMDSLLSDTDREVAVPVTYNCTVTAGKIDLGADGITDKLYIGFATTANPTQDQLDNYFNFQDLNDNDIFMYNTKLRVDSVTYGSVVDKTQSFSSWNTADGKSIFGGLSHWQKAKISSTITTIEGNVIKCTGAQFITSKVKVNDTVYISGATNNIPFSNNGEYLVDNIYSEDIIGLKIKSNNDFIFMANGNPASINSNKRGGESYGTLTVIIGKALPFIGKNGNIKINLPFAPPDGTYRITVPIARSIKSIQPIDLMTTLVRQLGGQIELGSKLIGNDTDALKPRIMISPKLSGNDRVLAFESKNPLGGAIRMYVGTGYFQLTANARWNGTNWSWDEMNDAYSMTFSESYFILESKPITSYPTPWAIWDNVCTFPKFNSDISINDATTRVTAGSHLTIGGTLTTGSALTASGTKLIPRIKHTLSSVTEYILIEEVKQSGQPGYRIYQDGFGDSVETFNCYWDGTNWHKDINSSTYNAKKIIHLKRGYKTYYYYGTSAWSDSAWSFFEHSFSVNVKEDFFNSLTPTNLVNSNLGVFNLTSISNALVGTGFINGQLKVVSPNTSGMSVRLDGPQIQFVKGPFYIRIKLSLSYASLLDTRENNGFFIGSSTSLYKIGLAAGSNDSTNIRFVYYDGTSDIYDIPIASADGNFYDIEIYNNGDGEVKIHVDSVPTTFISFPTRGFSTFSSTILLNSLTSPGSNAIMASIDKFYLWSAICN